MATQSSGAGAGSETLCKTEEAGKDRSSTLKLKLKKESKKIQWTEDTIDNEGKNYFVNECRAIIHHITFLGLGKKKSKICCVYKKPRPHLDCSSSEDEEDHCPGH